MKKTGILYFGLIIVLLMAIYYLISDTNAESISYNELVSKIENDEAKSVTLSGDKVLLYDHNDKVYTASISPEIIPNFYENFIQERVDNNSIKFESYPKEDNSKYFYLLSMVLPLLIIMFFMNNLFGRAKSQSDKAEDFTTTRAKIFNRNAKGKITFNDVAGLKEEKEELQEIVDFLREPRKFSELGARIPHGVLLVGPPGTGKTYISKAVAGEANVPFFSVSGSEFLELFVGVGASRVRDLFKKAKANAPCIIFVDEIDAVGRMRGSGVGGGHDEREQTLNQLLVEMDGFDKNEGIIIMAATNRPDILDPALLRPGRFDRQVYIGLPNVKERNEILLIHTKNKPLADDVDLNSIAKRTPGFSPADLENLINEAAILSARKDKKVIDKESLEESSIKVIAGVEKKSAVVTEKEKKLVSYHEAGHAIVSKMLEGTDPVHMITIVPRGKAGGFTYSVPDEDTNYITKKQLTNEIIVLLGGRAAEELVLKDISTGASNDIERVTNIARAMITKFGMNEKLGNINFNNESGELFLGKSIGHSKNISEEVLKIIDEQMQILVQECYLKAKSILSENMETLHKLANSLMEKETIYKEEFEEFFK